MVVREEFQNQEAFKCEVCGMHYRQRTYAEECEEHCREKGSCSTEVTKKSFERFRSG